ncbi:Cysteine-rich CPXCG [Lysobacter ruishenii]|uniref:Cysteine-rich CPXCG n=2 Tax=Aerolutibacter ruishenii TaxID=686800 RepID=A0A562M437_9GAMM|nr:Cysteine-rich CPXCG [Lysobacter ruishenii]
MAAGTRPSAGTWPPQRDLLVPFISEGIAMLPVVEVQCPYCGERIELRVENCAEEQRYTEDCPVCCKPMYVVVDLDDDGEPLVTVESEAGS